MIVVILPSMLLMPKNEFSSESRMSHLPLDEHTKYSGKSFDKNAIVTQSEYFPLIIHSSINITRRKKNVVQLNFFAYRICP